MTNHPAPDAMLAEMSACAYRLGMAFGRAAEQAADFRRKLELVQLFERCFFSVRVATALQLRLRREAASLERPAAGLREREDCAEREGPERGETDDSETDTAGRDGVARERLDADRDRESERASLPLLLATLTGIAADASALPGPQPAELPALVACLAEAARDGGPAPPRRALRSRLAGSAGIGISTGPPRAPPRPAPARALSPQRPRAATGPPHR